MSVWPPWCRERERRLSREETTLRHDVHVGAFLEEHSDDLVLTQNRRVHERRGAVGIGFVGARPAPAWRVMTAITRPEG